MKGKMLFVDKVIKMGFSVLVKDANHFMINPEKPYHLSAYLEKVENEGYMVGSHFVEYETDMWRIYCEFFDYEQSEEKMLKFIEDINR